MTSIDSAGPVVRRALAGAVPLIVPVTLLAAGVVLFLGAAEQRILILFMINLIAVVATGLYVGNSGVTSFGHVGFMGLGAYASALLTLPPAVKATMLPNLPGWLAAAQFGFAESLVVAALAVGLFALVIGIPVARLSGSAASITSLGLLIIIHSVLNGAKDITRGSQTFFGVERLTTVPVLLACVAIAILVARLFRDSTAGLELRASREDELAARAMGVDVARRRLAAWVLSAMLMAVAGGLLAHVLGAFSPKKFFFVDTFAILAMLIIGGPASVSGAVIGTFTITLITEFARRFEEGPVLPQLGLPQAFGLTQIVLGLGILLIMYRRPGGLFGLAEIDDWLFRQPIPVATAPLPAEAAPADAALTADRVTKRFAGLVALDAVDLSVRPGEIVGLIGPNGSGKTTLINALSGVVPATSGTVRIDGRDIAGLPSHRVARLGIGRSFQNIRLFKDLTVLENVIVAVTGSGRGRAGGAVAERAMAALAELGVDGLAGRRAGQLAYGEQRRVEIARALAMRPRYLLLDEPAAGMNPAESEALMRLLDDLRRRTGLGLLLVEHDLKLVMRLCDRVVVLNKGQVIAAGVPDQVQADPAVVEAYIGRRAARKPAALAAAV
ncbi:branched-chain amino acid transport system permease protein [Inquilinus ginsengisoli]|uniref:Branched-chain amino acid transport system permease protein n=1 Tax=Inquilinus ginsengisoli TaxID=363840 RepID=A0ABU1JLT2_9PROT|nr:branched-chain amino acid ABC transporter ATP-binding protein/permease [Inquilinus ginsengisoli]MDR6289570.1 branched-chain amino acid transport system permease protein [Inquilinus ginsengisoli]